jgi:outer membrane biosynthesis protein TonB
MHLSFLFGGLLIWNNNVSEFAEVRIIPLELVTVSDITNIKATRKLPEPEPEPEPEIEPEPSLDEPEIPEPEQETEAIPDDPLVEQPAVEPEAEQQASFDLDAFSAMVDQARKEKPDANTQTVFKSEVGAQNIEGAGEGTGSSLHYNEYIQTKMRNCYKIDTGAKDYQKLRVEVLVHLSQQGEVQNIDILNNMQIIASPNKSWRAARDNVIFALNDCAPYDKLPKADYENWKRYKFNFQPAIEG